MVGFFTKNLGEVYFIYGLVFFIMGVAILSQPRNKSGFKLADILWLLAAFALIHGLNEFLYMWVIIKHPAFFVLYRPWALAISFLLLFEFGRRLLCITLSSRSQYYKKLSGLFSFWLSLFMGAFVAAGLILYSNDYASGVIIVRYFLGFPGSILVGISFILYYGCNREIFDDIKIRKYFLAAAASFFVYGVAGGLIGPKGNLFLSSWLNKDSFLLLLRFPVQLLRAVCALVATWAVCGILRIFNWERVKLIESHSSTIEIVNKQLHNEIAHRKRLEEELRVLSFTDSVTGLYNHRGFLELGQQQMKLAKRNKQDVVLLFVDLDKLKWINDTFGHQEGDLALSDVAGVFRATFRESDIVARTGGDEFVVLLATNAGKDSISALIAKLLNKLNEHNVKATRGYPLSLSIGGAFSDANHPCSIDELLSNADKLMYKQKQIKGSNGK